MKLPAARPRGFLAKSAVAQPAFAKATAGPRHSSPPQDGGVFWRRRIKKPATKGGLGLHLTRFESGARLVIGMNEKDRNYWKGLAPILNEPRDPPKSPKQGLAFVDDAYDFVKALKGEVQPGEPTEIELFKRWLAVRKR